MTRSMVARRRVVVLQIALAVLFASVVALVARPAEAAYPGGNGLIVFESGFDLYAMPLDGSAPPVNIASTVLSPFTNPAVSPDGSQIAFSRDVAGNVAIWIADFDASGPSLEPVSGWLQVTAGPTDRSPTWSSDGADIAFSRRNVTTIASEAATAADTGGTTLTDDTPPSASFIAAGVLAGYRVTNERTGATGRVTAVGITTVTSTMLAGGDTDDEWQIGDTYTISPWNRQIFSVPSNSAAAVGLMLSAGGTTPTYDDSSPMWSPLGTKIAFETTRNGTSDIDIYTMDTDGSNPASVTGSSSFDAPARRPAWSPDGMRIAFETKKPISVADTNIWTVDATGGGNATNVTGSATGGDDDTDAAFSPDGKQIAFVRGGTGGDKTWTIDVDGQNPAIVSSAGSPALHRDPDWQPALVGVDDGYTVDEGATLVVAAPGVLGNDATVGALPGATAVEDTGPANGTLTLNADGSFTYTHDGSETTSDSFTYRPVQGAVQGSVATVTITVNPIDDPPVHMTGLVDQASGKWYLYDADGNMKTSFFFGNPGDYPFMGDWDGDGIETPGMYRQSDGFVYLRNSNTAGNADIRFFFGDPGDVPIAGDFNGDGFDTVSIYRPSNQTFYIINALGKNGGGLGAAEFSYVFGNPGDKPFVGDFDGDGIETVGLHRESTGLVYFRNSHSEGNADNQFIFGDPGDRLIAGDWTNDATFTPALFRPSDTTMYFRYTNSQGNADNQYIPVPTDSTWLPVSGRTE